MREKENFLIRVLKALHIIKSQQVDKADMCKSAQDVCNHNCETCAWH